MTSRNMPILGFGFIVSRFALFLRELALLGRTATKPPSGVSLGLGTSLILLGVAVNVIAAGQHVRFVRFMRAGSSEDAARPFIGVTIALALALAGFVMAAYLFVLDAAVSPH